MPTPIFIPYCIWSFLLPWSSFTLRSSIQTSLAKTVIIPVLGLLNLSQTLCLENLSAFCTSREVLSCDPKYKFAKKVQTVLSACDGTCRHWHFSKAGTGLSSASVLKVKALGSALALFNGKIQSGLHLFFPLCENVSSAIQ